MNEEAWKSNSDELSTKVQVINNPVTTSSEQKETPKEQHHQSPMVINILVTNSIEWRSTNKVYQVCFFSYISSGYFKVPNYGGTVSCPVHFSPDSAYILIKATTRWFSLLLLHVRYWGSGYVMLLSSHQLCTHHQLHNTSWISWNFEKFSKIVVSSLMEDTFSMSYDTFVKGRISFDMLRNSINLNGLWADDPNDCLQSKWWCALTLMYFQPDIFSLPLRTHHASPYVCGSYWQNETLSFDVTFISTLT